jgi:hypothetical protein
VFRTLLRQVNLLCSFRAPEGVRWAQDLYWFGQNVPTSSHRRPALPAPLTIKAHIRGYKQAREGGETPKSLFMVDVVTKWSHS